jgi:electron transport complex protein RnfC
MSLSLEQTDRLLEGLEILLQLFPAAKAVIGVEVNKPQAIRLLQDKTAALPRISVQPLKTKYPQGGERMLIHAVTGRDIYSRKLPIDAGCVVLNVSTTVAIWAAVCRHIPQIVSIMTVTGDGAAAPCNLAVPVGTSHRELLEAAGGLQGEPEKLISGGPLMGLAITDLDTPVQKTSSAVLAMQRDEVAAWEPTPCMRCGRCMRACPVFLMPVKLAQMADGNDFTAFEAADGMECIECGSCAYVCPAKRYLVQSMRYGKRQTGAAIRARKAAEQKKAAESTPKGGNEA